MQTDLERRDAECDKRLQELEQRQRDVEQSQREWEDRNREIQQAFALFQEKSERLDEEFEQLRRDREDLADQRAQLIHERARLEQFASEQAEQYALMSVIEEQEQDRRDREVSIVGDDSPADEEVIYDDVVLGGQFEHVNPALLGEEGRPSRSRANAAGTPAPVDTRVPVDPVADQAYDELVDRLVQFNYSKKKKWYAFWR